MGIHYHARTYMISQRGVVQVLSNLSKLYCWTILGKVHVMYGFLTLLQSIVFVYMNLMKLYCWHCLSLLWHHTILNESTGYNCLKIKKAVLIDHFRHCQRSVWLVIISWHPRVAYPRQQQHIFFFFLNKETLYTFL